MTKKHRKEILDALFREKVLLEMLKVAGVGMWTYSTETGKLRYIGFADTIHRHDELQYVDPLDYLKLMNGEDAQIVTQFMAALHAGRLLRRVFAIRCMVMERTSISKIMS